MSPDETPMDDAQSAVETPKTRTFELKAGERDAAVVDEYLKTLDPDEAGRVIDQIVERTLDVAFEEGEAERIVKEVIFKRRYRRPVKVLDGFTLTCQSLDEYDWEWIMTPAVGEPAEGTVHERQQAVRMVCRSVCAVGSDKVPDTDEDRLKFWLGFNHDLISLVILAVQRFSRKVRAALLNKEVLGKS